MKRFRPTLGMALWLFWIWAVVLLVGVFLPSPKSMAYFRSPLILLLGLVLGISTLFCFPKNWRKGWSQVLSHAGVFWVLLGAAASALWAQRGTLALLEGEAAQEIQVQVGQTWGEPIRLPAPVRLLQFEIDTYGPPDKSLSLLSWSDSEERWIPLKTVPGEKGEVLEAAGWRVEVVRSIDMAGGPGESLLVLAGPKDKAEQRVLFASAPNDPRSFLAEDVRLLYTVHADVKAYRSTLQAEEPGQEGKTLVTEVNRPALWKGWLIYQESYGQDQGQTWSRLEFVRDPGVAAVFFGYALAAAGGVLSVFQRKGGKE